MKLSWRKIALGTLGVLVVSAIVAGASVANLATFPGKVATPRYTGEVKSEGVKSAFRKGVVYRYPGMVPMLEVSGSHNDKGLAFSEETLRLKKPNPKGFPLAYLIRMALEESSTLEEIYPLFKRYPTIGACGCVWSDRDEGRGAVIELTPTGWAVNELEGSLLWNFNHFYDVNLKKLQHPRTNLAGFNLDRDAIAATFPKKPEYTLQDAIRFLQLQIGPDGTDYSWAGTHTAICNDAGSQMVVFHPKSDGFYLATGTYYAARQDIWHVSEDSARAPELFMKALPLDPLKEEVARIRNRIIN